MSARPYCTPPDPHVRRPHPRGRWELCEPVTVRDGDRAWVIPTGFRYDLASIPRPFRPLMETADLGITPPLVHDHLYRHAGRVGGYRYSRARADRLFKELMKVEGVPGWRWRLAYAAVRLGGGAAWERASEAPEQRRAA